jgi:predicted nucleotidyltransferase
MIQSVGREVPELISAFGFGSFFRGEHSNDCDLLLVVADNTKNLGDLHAKLSSTFRKLGRKIAVRFDLTVLTEAEHRSKPLREHNNLLSLC